VETEPPAGRDAKRDRILAKILLNPAASDRAIASELGVSRNTVKAIRAMVKRD
jgi:FixJ family two-component response regulator